MFFFACQSLTPELDQKLGRASQDSSGIESAPGLDSDADSDTDTDSDSDTDTDTDSDTDADNNMVFSPGAAYPVQSVYLLKGLQPDFWANHDEVSGNMAGSVSMNLVWASWQPENRRAPCNGGEVAYEGYCFIVDANVDASIADYSARGLSISAIVYGVPAWARTSRVCSPVAPGFEVFCAPDNAADYARFVGMLARRYNGANGVGRVSDFVIHNEVNSNTWFDVGCGEGVACDTATWTGIYVDNYIQAFDAVRAEQAEAKVFVSLDHHFASPDYDQPSAYNALLSGQTVLEAVAAAAGGRDWRVAFHPYPPDLLDAAFGPDDWPKVTYGNVGALLGWLESRWPGSMAARDVHLTESGVNSLSPSSEAEQAAGICQSFYNILGTPGINRYIYHRMIDHPDETAAGLGVGLWSSSGVAKQGWGVWALANRFDLNPPQLSCGFESLPYVRLTRSYAASRGHWASSRLPPSGFSEEAGWWVLREDQGGMHLLFECAVGNHNMLTTDPGCEGQRALGPVGWVFQSEVAGSVGLYRCLMGGNGDHFISTDPGCEGQETEFLLGFVL